MHKRIKKMEIGGVSSGNIISSDMLKQLGLNLGNYNAFISASMNKIKSDIGNFKDTKSDSDADERNPFSTAKGMFSQKTVDSVRN